MVETTEAESRVLALIAAKLERTGEAWFVTFVLWWILGGQKPQMSNARVLALIADKLEKNRGGLICTVVDAWKGVLYWLSQQGRFRELFSTPTAGVQHLYSDKGHYNINACQAIQDSMLPMPALWQKPQGLDVLNFLGYIAVCAQSNINQCYTKKHIHRNRDRSAVAVHGSVCRGGCSADRHSKQRRQIQTALSYFFMICEYVEQ